MICIQLRIVTDFLMQGMLTPNRQRHRCTRAATKLNPLRSLTCVYQLSLAQLNRSDTALCVNQCASSLATNLISAFGAALVRRRIFMLHQHEIAATMLTFSSQNRGAN